MPMEPRYLMVVNRRCQPSRNLRTATIDLSPSRLSGPARPYLVRELYEKEAGRHQRCLAFRYGLLRSG